MYQQHGFGISTILVPMPFNAFTASPSVCQRTQGFTGDANKVSYLWSSGPGRRKSLKISMSATAQSNDEILCNCYIIQMIEELADGYGCRRDRENAAERIRGRGASGRNIREAGHPALHTQYPSMEVVPAESLCQDTDQNGLGSLT
jgi:hypothetical protein